MGRGGWCSIIIYIELGELAVGERQAGRPLWGPKSGMDLLAEDPDASDSSDVCVWFKTFCK